jgi:predicted HTH transcriptional regulator
MLLHNPKFTAKALATRLDLTERQIERILSDLKKKKRIIRHGASKNGYWEVIGK